MYHIILKIVYIGCYLYNIYFIIYSLFHHCMLFKNCKTIYPTSIMLSYNKVYHFIKFIFSHIFCPPPYARKIGMGASVNIILFTENNFIHKKARKTKKYILSVVNK